MSGQPSLLLPGERGRSQIVMSRAIAAAVAGFLWLPIQATVLPALGFADLPLDPILPLIAAFALGGRGPEAWALALTLGYVADFYTGVASGRLVLQYAFVVCLATPLHGRVVLRDRLVPVFGVSLLALLSGLAVLVFLGAMGATLPSDWSRLPLECVGTGCAAIVLWPVYRRIAGWQDERSMGMGRRR